MMHLIKQTYLQNEPLIHTELYLYHGNVYVQIIFDQILQDTLYCSQEDGYHHDDDKNELFLGTSVLLKKFEFK